MAWFKKPVAYRSYSDGTYEIIERRSLLPIYAVALAVAATLTGGPFLLKSPPPIGPGADGGRSPYVTSQTMLRIIQTQDSATIYRILSHYSELNAAERYCFWSAARALDMTDLAKFGRFAIEAEGDQKTRELIGDLIDFADR